MTVYNNKSGNGDLHFADELWKTANKLRGSVESAEYKHIVLGLLFLKYISDAFEERQQYLIKETHNPDNPDYYISVESDAEFVCEDKDEYLGANIFWVPKEACWSYLMADSTKPRRLLRRKGFKPKESNVIIMNVMEQAESLYEDWPEAV